MLGERPAVILTTVANLLISVGAILGLLPLSGTAERAAAAVCILTVFLTNVLATALAGEQVCENNSQDLCHSYVAWRIWWISRRAANFLGGDSRKKYMDLPAIL